MSLDTFLAQVTELDDCHSPFLQAASLSADHNLQLVIRLQGWLWGGADIDETWQVTAVRPTEQRLSLAECFPSLEPQYPRLKAAQSPRISLGYAAAPADSAAFLADLRATHDESQWDYFGRYELPHNLALGYGIFTQGPEELMQRYFEVLERWQMRPSLLMRYEVHNPPTHCLHLSGDCWHSDCYVLAQGFKAQRLS